jgi:hypothetical protein
MGIEGKMIVMGLGVSSGSSEFSASSSDRWVMLGGDLEELFGGDFDLVGWKISDEQVHVQMMSQAEGMRFIIKVNMSKIL